MITLDQVTRIDAASDFFSEENVPKSDHNGGGNHSQIKKNDHDGLGRRERPIIKKA